MDTLTPSQRHNNMSHIRSTENKPEKAIRSQLFKYGFRFRKNDRRYEGKPDIVLPHFHAMVFINGCFWHAHGCEKFKMPKSNTEFWQKKFERNKERDKKTIADLISQGWRICVVWECSITGKKRRQKVQDVASKISLWLDEHPEETFIEL